MKNSAIIVYTMYKVGCPPQCRLGAVYGTYRKNATPYGVENFESGFSKILLRKLHTSYKTLHVHMTMAAGQLSTPQPILLQYNRTTISYRRQP